MRAAEAEFTAYLGPCVGLDGIVDTVRVLKAS